ncbi:hypothetical protein BJV82DRAFT_608626 [Fennellomyces sp. T-0311]|nr:hypothetical protein BJV82DRAFT_608626 [Fennellomyces sp. T-0311]
MSSDAWNRLDRLVQLSYSATDVCLVYSEYKASCWHLRVLSERTMYHLRLNNANALENVMQQRQPIAASPDQFVEWFSSSMIQGQMAIIADTLRVGDTKCWLELRLEKVDETRLRHEFSWQLLIQLALHVQKQGCVIDNTSHHRSSEARMNELQQENETLKAELKAALSVQTSAERTAGSRRPQQRPRAIAQPRTGGMSIVNPGVKRYITHAHAPFFL